MERKRRIEKYKTKAEILLENWYLAKENFIKTRIVINFFACRHVFCGEGLVSKLRRCILAKRCGENENCIKGSYC